MQRENRRCLQLNQFLWWYPDLPSRAWRGLCEHQWSISRRSRLSLLQAQGADSLVFPSWSATVTSWQMPKTNLVSLWRTTLYMTIKVCLMTCSHWRSCSTLWLSQTGFSTFFLPPWISPAFIVSLLFVRVCKCWGALPCAVKQMLPPITEKLHFVVDLTGVSAALDGRGLMRESQPRVPAPPLCNL